MASTTTADHGLGHKKRYPLRVARLGQDHPLVASRPLHPMLAASAAPLPAKVDLRKNMPPVYDQGQLGSCTANALCAAVQFSDPTHVPGSRLFVYYNERVLEADVKIDAGAQLSDGILTLERYGVCPEAEWPYEISQFAKQPPALCYRDAASRRVHRASAVPASPASMKRVLTNGFPFVVGIAVYPEFETPAVAKSGTVPMPTAAEIADPHQCLGGHAILCVGYDDAKGVWIMRNSWGATWGDAGYFTLPYPYLLHPALASDAWALC